LVPVKVRTSPHFAGVEVPVPPFVMPRVPVTSAVRETVSHVAAPAPLRERMNWLVQDAPWYSESEPSAPASGRALVILVMAKVEEVAFVVEASVAWNDDGKMT
jgi:hypothetical protein